MDVKRKKICVIGIGKSGLSAALLLKKHGSEVYFSDSGSSDQVKANSVILKKQAIDGETGGHTGKFIEGCHLIVRSPGVYDSAKPLAMAKDLKIPVVSEIEVASWFCPSPIIAVTGTNGKSTTTTLIGQLLKDARKDARVCGNIGNPFCGEIDTLTDKAIVVLEVSSFQLQDIMNFRPKAAVVLNITQNHLDRHADIKEYAGAKSRIVENQTESDWCILNHDDPLARKVSESASSKVLFFSRKNKVKGSYKDGDALVIDDGSRTEIIKADQICIKGGHNFENAAASVLAASLFGVEPDSMARTLKDFKGLEHRCEYVDQINGIQFVNDSKATSVDAAMRALDSVEGKAVLIAGGRDKASNFSVAKSIVSKKVSHLVLIGEAAQKMEREYSGEVGVTKAKDLREAVFAAYKNARKGQTVLLSPMCASFDQFESFEHRGRVFKDSVKELRSKIS